MKKYKALRKVSLIFAALALIFVIINVIPPEKNVEENPFIRGEGELPMIAAHRGGGVNNPENTLLAFREAVDKIGADVIESDLYLTKDGYLVYNHDAYIDRTCNVNGDISQEEVQKLCEDEENRHYISDMTLEELQKYNFGYYFTDESGARIYKDVENPEEYGLQIATADMLFAEFYETHPDLLFIVEIKNSGELGYEACRVLDSTLEEYPGYRDRIVVGTFHSEIEEELMTNYPYLMRGASEGSAAKFVITQYLGVNIFDNGTFGCLQIPTGYDLGVYVPLDTEPLVSRAHRRNIAVQYWTINDAETMRELTELGCDCIMTDDPQLLKSVLEEYR